MEERLDALFFARDALELAPALIGKVLVHRMPDGDVRKARITETEAYCGVTDSACHAYRGRTERNKLLWAAPGTAYIYLCYGVHWLLNIISGEEGDPQGVLIRSCEGCPGPGRLTKALGIDKSLNADSFVTSSNLWIEDDGLRPAIRMDKRVGIGYASEEDQNRLWRFVLADT